MEKAYSIKDRIMDRMSDLGEGASDLALVGFVYVGLPIMAVTIVAAPFVRLYKDIQESSEKKPAVIEMTTIAVPKTTSVPEGYVVPSKLEISCLEADTKRPCIPIVEYDGKRLLLQYDGTEIRGTPYEIAPVGLK